MHLDKLYITVEITPGLARTMTYKETNPTVRAVTRLYNSGISVAKNTIRKEKRVLNHASSPSVLQQISVKVPLILYFHTAK